jgi:tetratricopeptide (TPR) repeat protein/tRNA A-37 threonylcarbamoyl transferase component Bud32
MISGEVSHYRLLERLGAGAMGEVYLAEDKRLGRQVALKFLRPELLGDPRARQRMEFEARAAAILNHPNITTLYEFDGEAGFLSFEFVKGHTLEDRLEQPMTPLEAVRASLAVCRGLGHAHGRSVVHRDLKPANVLVGNDGSIKLTDFGLAKVRDSLAQATQEIVAGTPAYMSPERIGGQGSDHRGDLFALGVLIHRAICGKLPWPGESVMEILFAVLQHEPEPLATPDGSPLPPALSEVVTKLLAKEPDDRLASADEAEALLLEAEAWLLLPADKRPSVVEAAAAAAAPAGAPATPGPVRPEPVRERGEPALLGRDAEIARLSAALASAESGTGGAVLIRGTAGIGKSRLVSELEERCRGRKVLFLKGRCQQHGGRNFGPLVDALEQFARGVTGGGDRYLADLTADPEALGALLPTLKILLDDDPARGGAPRSREEIWFLIETLLKRMAEVVPLVLVVDDLHWADEGTISLAWHLARNVRQTRILLLGLYRPEDMVDAGGRSREPAELIRSGSSEDLGLEALDLGPIDEATTTELIRAAYPDSPVTLSLAPLVHRRAQGNPLFTIEILRLLGTPEAHESTPPGAGETTRNILPRNIADVVARRLARLSNEERELLDVAAVEGEVFHADVIAEATGLARLKLLSRLRDLHKTHGLIEPTGEGYRFTQGVVREMLLKELPADLKQECHSVVASYLLKGYADRADYAGAISNHLFRAARYDESLPFLWRAAAEARRLFLNDRALLYIERALEARKQSGGGAFRLTQLLGARVEVLLKLGRPAVARESAEEMRKLASEEEGNPDRPEAEELVGAAALEQGDYDAAQRHLEAAFEHYRTDESARDGLPRSQRRLAALAYRRGDFEAALQRYAEARSWLEAAGDRSAVAEMRVETAQLLARRGDLETATTELEATLAEFRSLGDQHGEAKSLTQLGNVHFRRGRHREAQNCYEEALRVAGGIGDLQALAVLQASLGNLNLVQGDVGRASEAYQEALRRFRSIGDRRGVAQVLMALGNAAFTRDDFEEAADWYRQSLAPREAMRDRWGLANSLDNLGVAEYRLGRWRDALGHIHGARSIREELGDRPGLAESALNLGALRAAVGDLVGARSTLDEALRLAADMGDARKEVRARLGLAGLALRMSEGATVAANHLAQSNARGVSDPVLQARSLLLEALAGSAADPVTTGERFRGALAAAESSGSLAEQAAARLADGRRRVAADPGEAAAVAADAAEVLDLVGGGRHPLLELAALRLLESASGEPPAERIRELVDRLNEHRPEGVPARTAADWEILPVP